MKSKHDRTDESSSIELLRKILRDAVMKYKDADHDSTYPMELPLSQTVCEYVEGVDDFNLYYADRSLLFDNEGELFELYRLSQQQRILQKPSRLSDHLQGVTSPVFTSVRVGSSASSKHLHEADEQSSSIELGESPEEDLEEHEISKRFKSSEEF